MHAGPALIDSVLPPEAVAAERLGAHPRDVGLHPEEAALIADAAPRRREQFAAGRTCARQALARLGVNRGALGVAPSGAPLWPPGVTGSITHCRGYAACAVARTDAVAGLGIDAEPDEPLPAGVCEQIATPAERELLAGLSAERPGISWDRLLFCAKEAAYKAWQAVEPRRIGFDEATVTVDPERGVFDIRLLPAGPAPVPDPRSTLRGRWACGSGLVVCALALPARWDETP